MTGFLKFDHGTVGLAMAMLFPGLDLEGNDYIDTKSELENKKT